MKIALITDGIWPYVLGGMQKHSYYLCKYLAQENIQVDLFHFNQSDYDIQKLEFFSEEEKKYIRPVVVPFPSSAKGFGHYIINSYRYSLDVFENIKDSLDEYDLIYTKGFTGWHFVREKGRGAKKFPPIAVKFHGYEMFQEAPDLKSWFQQKLLLQKPVKEICQKADLVFSYGGKITGIIKNIGVHQDKIIELPSGVEESILVKETRSTGSVKKFLFLGRYERRKGIKELSIAISRLDQTKNFEIHFIGPIPAGKKIESPKVIYHGEIRDKSQLMNLIRNCDILVCPSWSEGLPNVILEAMANGLAVIATNVGATAILVNDKTGWLIETCSVKRIKSALENVISTSPEQIDQKKNASLELIKNNFTWEKLIKQFLEKVRAKI
jgi:glycosyltransferase involved in cell wall biosynthesis